MLLFLLVNFIVRVILIFHPITQSSFKFLDLFKIFVFGLIADFFVFIVVSLFLWLYLLFISNSKYYKPYGYIIFSGMVLFLFYITFGNTILNEYGGSAHEIGISFIALKTILFGLLLFIPKHRNVIRYWLFSFVIFLFVFLIIQNGISEYFFWNEFGVRYNFIAVDYLVYTNEVIGTIMQSYPVIPIFTGLFIVVSIVTFYIVKKSKSYLDTLPTFIEKLKITGLYISLCIVSLFLIPLLSSKENSENNFANELQANGLNKFYLAFKNSELDYFKFYKTLPNKEAFAILKNQITSINRESTLRKINGEGIETQKNVVLITVESFSGAFMKCYGNEKNLTPFIDSLASKSLLFTDLYAVGNRTVRGLEAITLCIPPTAGESVVKRKDNKNKFSTASIFLSKGYSVKYMYGGDAFFDSMQDFFGGNGYDVIDQKTFKPNEITFQNIWGVCDEDMYRKAISVMNSEAKANKPFFNHIMTVSNHRPFTYPNNKIDIPGDAKSRDGGVKYTDYALKQFFEMAKKQSWFKNTVFVILADHCASSSGKTELPLDKYRIPALIFDPNKSGARCTKLMSQIDVMPTLFSVLNFDYKSKFFGQDVLKSDYKPRAFIATYQNLGLIKDNVLTLLSPKQKVKQYRLALEPIGNLNDDFEIKYSEKLLLVPRKDLIKETISYYQTASWVLKNEKYNK